MDLVEQHYAPLGAIGNDDDDDFIHTTYNVCYIILTFFFSYLDNVTLHLDGVLYLRVTDPFKVCFFSLRQTFLIGCQL